MKRTCVFLVLILLLLLGSASSFSETLQAAPLVTETGSSDGMIRVWLSSIRSNTTYDITISGAYAMGSTQLSSGSQVKIEFSGGNVYATVGGSRQNMGTSVTLSRQSGGVKIAQSLASGNTYPGDMRFFYASGTAYVVCYLYIEDYVYGVLPYEMDNSFPLEALKAQAVTARTYAMRAKSSSGNYDVTDTTTHQVFRGVNYTKTRCIQAVDETWGVVLKYGSAYAGTYYSASNGGQTEAAQNAWGGASVPYLTIQDDPYDLANVRAIKKSYMIYSTPQQGSSTSAYSMIQSALASKLGGSASQYTINQVTDCLLHTPLFAAPSKVYSKLQVSVTYNGGQSATVDIPVFSTVESTLGLSINGEKNELLTVERESNGFRITSRRYGHGVGMSQRGAEKMGESGISYAQILGFYYGGVQRVRMNLTTNWPSASPTPVLPDEPEDIQEGTLAKVTLENPNDRLNLRKEANDQSTIIARVPHGEMVTVLSAEGLWVRVSYDGQTGYALQQYLVLEQSVETPSTDSTQQSAIVTLSSGSLNLRSGDYATASIINTIPNGTTVTLLAEGASWSQVSYAGRVGYVMSKYLTIVAAESGTEATEPSPSAGSQTAVVALDNPTEILNFRLYPMTSAPILARLSHETAVEVLERGADWSNVRYMGQSGYVMSVFMRFSDSTGEASTTEETPAPATTATPAQLSTAKTYAVVDLTSGSLNLRQQPHTGARVYRTIPNGAQIEILQIGDDWCEATYEGETGYVMRSCIALIDAGAESPTVTPTETPSAAETVADVLVTAPPTASLLPASSTAWVYTEDRDRVNLRKTQSLHAVVLIRVPYGEAVEVVRWSDEWTEVKYDGYSGYIMTHYLRDTMPEGGTTAEAASTGTNPPAATQTPDGKSVWIISENGGSINFRSQRSTTSDVIALIPWGAEVTMLEIDSEWCKAIYKGLTGYVMAGFVSEAPVATEAPAQTETPSAEQNAAVETPTETQQPDSTPEPSGSDVYGDAQTTVINSGKTRLNSPTATLHLRFAADDLAAETGKLSQHDVVEVLQRYGDRWLYVRKGTEKGYALAEHFVLDYRFAQVKLSDTSSSLTIRESASRDASAIGDIAHGKMLTVTGTSGDFAKVRLADGTVGYVVAEYIQYKE